MTKSPTKRKKSGKKTASVRGRTKRQGHGYAEVVKSIDALLQLCELQRNLLNHLKKRVERLKSS